MRLRSAIANPRAKIAVLVLSVVTLSYQACGPAPVDVPVAEQDSRYLISTDDTLSLTTNFVNGSNAYSGYIVGAISGIVEDGSTQRILGWACFINADYRTELQVIAARTPNVDEAVIGSFEPTPIAKENCNGTGNSQFSFPISSENRRKYANRLIYIREKVSAAGTRSVNLSGSGVYLISDPTIYPTTAPNPQPSNNTALTTVFRYFRTDVGGHFLTTNPMEISANTPFKYEGAAFTVFATAQSDSYAIYRCYIPGWGRHMISTDANCEGQRTEGIFGYVKRDLLSSAGVPLRPLYRCHHPITGHLATVHSEECTNNNYKVESILGYVP